MKISEEKVNKKSTVVRLVVMFLPLMERLVVMYLPRW